MMTNVREKIFAITAMSLLTSLAVCAQPIETPVGFFSETSSNILLSKIISDRIGPRYYISCAINNTVDKHAAEYYVLLSEDIDHELPAQTTGLTLRQVYDSVRSLRKPGRFHVAVVSLSWTSFKLKTDPIEIYPKSKNLRETLSFAINTGNTRITVDGELNNFKTILFFLNRGMGYAFYEEGFNPPPLLNNYNKYNIDQISMFGCYLWLPVGWLNHKLGTREFMTTYTEKKININNPHFIVNDSLIVTSDLFLDGLKYSQIRIAFGKDDLVTRHVKLTAYVDDCKAGDSKCRTYNSLKQFASARYGAAAQQYIGRRLKLFEVGLDIKIELDKYSLDLDTDGMQSLVDGQNLIFFVNIK